MTAPAETIAKQLIERGTKSSSGLVLILDEHTIVQIVTKALEQRV